MEPALSLIPHIVKDSFDFIQRLEKQCHNNTLLSTCDIKSLYTNIRHDLFLTAIEYWIEHLQNNLPLLERFTKQFVLEGLSIILKFNYFYINKSLFHQIKGTAMGTKFAVVGSNLVVAYKEIKLFALLPQVYPQDFVDFLLRNYFRFLDDIFHKWLENFDIKKFYDLINSLDEDLKFIFENPSRTLNFLDIQLKIVNDALVFDIYYKPTNSFNYLTYSSCHPSHTKNNIALSLAKRIINIVTDNREKRLSELKKHLIERNHPPEITDYTFTKCFQPKLNNSKDLEKIIFTRTFNPNHVINLNKLTRSLENIRSNELKQCFQNKTVQLATRQPKNLRKILTKAKFEENPLPSPVKEVVFFPCNDCIYHGCGYFKPCKYFQFKVNDKSMIWHYKRYFNCDSKNVIYILMCNTCDWFYLGQTISLKQRIRKHKSDVFHPQNSFCKKCSEHLRDCSKMKEPFFRIYPFLYESKKELREFKEKRFIMRWKPQLNTYQ